MNLTQFLSGTPARDYVFQQMPYEEQIKRAAEMIKDADTVLMGTGAGLSTAAGLNYGGKRFNDNFGEFIKRYGSMYMKDMYSAGFYPFPTEEAKWGYWSKHSYMNRIEPEGLALYKQVYEMTKDKEHFVLTTNVDHQFFKAGFGDVSGMGKDMKNRLDRQKLQKVIIFRLNSSFIQLDRLSVGG